MEITIKKVKLTSVATLELEYTETVEMDGETFRANVTKKCEHTPHEDLLNTFDTLKPHLVALCELDTEQEENAISNFKVTGFTIGGSNEHEGVTLVGRKGLANNRVLNLVAPFTKWEDEHNGYEASYELKILIDKACDEAVEYLNMKMKPNPQQSLFPA